MHLEWLELDHFRSYTRLRFEPDPEINVLIGRNGAGKTNILEAIGYLSMQKSFRRTPDTALITAIEDSAVIRGGFADTAGSFDIAVEIPSSGRRQVLVNGKRPARLSDVATTAPVVAFLPDDLDVVKRGPTRRREYLDDLGAQLVPTVGADQREYEKALRQRNSLLRQEGRNADPMTLDVWDVRVAEAGGRVLANRVRLLGRLRRLLTGAYRTVGGAPGETLLPVYGSSWAATGDIEDGMDPDFEKYASALLQALEARRNRDMEMRSTSAGPHRDDPGFVLDGRDVRVQASQGEQRSVALSLRIAAYQLLEQRHGRPPILLLDDVFSELDPGRADGVTELLPHGQVFVTSARDDEVPQMGRRWRVGEGVVE
ncbi:MAG: DNA replication/repair protein RecF [Acidimicrobiia bacterium]|nr:DNA replication/repair protein RecF [Acidimicrobiia bacterium]